MLPRCLNFKSLHISTYQRLLFKCSSRLFHNARQLFDKSPQPSIALINTSMLSYIHQNLCFKALEIFKTQLHHGLPHWIDEDSAAIAFKACRRDPKPGMMLHGFVLSSGLLCYRVVSNSLMNMYCKSGKIDRAIDVFSSMDDPDIVSYNTILSGFEKSEDALDFACKMNSDGVCFDPVSYSTVLSFCFDKKGFLFGFQLHSMVLKSGLDYEVFVGNGLISMYSRWGRISEAERVFYEMPNKDLISWNAMLCGYSQDGNYGLDAIWVFREMMKRGMKLDHVSLTAAFSACGYEGNLDIGQQVHGLSIKAGYRSHVSVCNILMSMYMKYEATEDAKLVFRGIVERNVVSWTTMISISEEDCVSLFHEMRLDEVYPNDVTLLATLHAVTVRNWVNDGQMIHGFCVKTSFASELNVANSLVTMYAQFGSLGESVKVFDELRSREIVSWNALISGYVHNGLYQEALEAFMSTVLETKPNEYTFGSVLSGIASAEAISLRHGERCHSHLLKLGLNNNAIVSASLLDMYAKRGSLSESRRVFGEIMERTQIAWTAIISAYARHGDYESLMDLFKEMERENVRPDSITFLAVLTACARKGMVDRGSQIWDSMKNEHMVQLTPEHYACMVDMLGRAGRLKEAEELLFQIPGGPRLSALQSLLGSCRIHGDMEMGQRIADALFEMEPEESGSYVLMSNLYAEKGDWEKVAIIRRRMRDKRVKKEVGFSWVDVGDADSSLRMHGFSSDDMSHPHSEEIYKMARWLGMEMKFLDREKEKEGFFRMNSELDGKFDIQMME